MQTSRFGAVLAATVVVTASAIGGTSAAPYKSANGYTITPPKGWTTSNATAGTEVVFMSPTRENLNVVSQQVPKGTTMEQARAQSIVLLRRVMTKYKVLGQGTSTLGGQRALTLTSGYVLNQPSQKLRAYQEFTIRSGRLFVFTCTAREAVYPKFAAKFRGMLSSVRWTK